MGECRDPFLITSLVVNEKEQNQQASCHKNQQTHVHDCINTLALCTQKPRSKKGQEKYHLHAHFHQHQPEQVLRCPLSSQPDHQFAICGAFACDYFYPPRAAHTAFSHLHTLHNIRSKRFKSSTTASQEKAHNTNYCVFPTISTIMLQNL